MNKKGKILLNLSTLAMVISIGAQFYTNYKIDQTLKQFPYHFNHQFTIQVEERNSDFFTRDLVFSLQQGNEKSDFIHTELTALPFAIQAKSYLTADIIKTLNQKLNITIDKHHISSQFAVFTNQLQSVVNTEFRDITNTSQTQETEISYSTSSKKITMNTQLSGWNNEQISLKGITGEYILNPIGNSEYDLAKADLNIKHTNINLLDGEDTHIELKEGKYQLNKSNNINNYDLILSTAYEDITAHNKKTKDTEEQFQLNKFSLSLQQKSIPSNINFLQKFQQLDPNNINIKASTDLLLDFLFNNDEFGSTIEFNSANLSNGDTISKINNAKIEFNIQNKEKTNINPNFSIKLAQFNIKEKNENPIEFILKNASFNLKMNNINLEKELDFFRKYIPQSLSQSPSEKDNLDFIKDIKTLAEQHQTKTESTMSIGEAYLKNSFSLKDLNYNYQDLIEGNVFNIKNHITLGNLNLDKENMQFNDLSLTLPIEIVPKDEYIKASLCSQHLYSYFCINNLSPESYYKQNYDMIYTNIKNATLETYLDTLPKSKNAQKITAILDLNIPKGKDIFDKLSSTEMNAQISIPTALFDEITENQDNQFAKIKQEKSSWQQLYQLTSEYRLIEKENYILNLSFEDGLLLLNGNLLNYDE